MRIKKIRFRDVPIGTIGVHNDVHDVFYVKLSDKMLFSWSSNLSILESIGTINVDGRMIHDAIREYITWFIRK